MWREVLKDVEKEIEASGYELRKGLSAFQILALEAKVLRKFGFTFPKTYRKFLRITDGLEYNGYCIFGIAEDEEYLQLLEYNDMMKDVDDEEMANILIFGEGNDDDWYVYDKKAREYQVSGPSGDVWERFDTFDELLEYVLNSSLDRFDPEDDEEEHDE